jgi:hypothetical protein
MRRFLERNDIIMKRASKSIAAIFMAAGIVISSMGTVVSAEWVKKGSDYYYLNSDGTYKTGWIETKDGDYYYCLKSGKMAKSCSVTINGVTYKFGKDGKALNKPTESKTTTNSSSKNKDNKTANKNEIVATKNQNTFPALVTYGVYCGMSKSDFKALKKYEDFEWDDDNEAYIVGDSYYVTIEDGRVSSILRYREASYGYTTRTGYKSLASAESAISSWRKKMLKVHKNKELISDTTTDSYYSDGYELYATEFDNVYYSMTDIRWDTTQDYFYVLEGYHYIEADD